MRAFLAAFLALLFLASPLAQASSTARLPVRVVVQDCVESFTDPWKFCHASVDNCQYLDNCVGAWVDEWGKFSECVAGVCTPWLPFCVTVAVVVAKTGLSEGGCAPLLADGNGDPVQVLVPAGTGFDVAVYDPGHVLPGQVPPGTIGYLADPSLPDDWTPK